jgi:hypothetical protein
MLHLLRGFSVVIPGCFLNWAVSISGNSKMWETPEGAFFSTDSGEVPRQAGRFRLRVPAGVLISEVICPAPEGGA